jgi:Tol biopolymer transport system component
MLRLIALLLLAGLLIPAAAQDAVPPVTGAVALNVPNDASPRVFALPDGSGVYYERAVRLNGHRDYYLCVLDADPNVPVCSMVPQQNPRGFEPDPNGVVLPMAASPDGQQIVVTGQPFLTQVDSDLLVFDRGDMTWRNLTDDGYEGALPAAASVDSQPVWSPDGAHIAFERVIFDGTNPGRSVLAVIEVGSGAVRELLTLAAATPGGVVGGLDWSPDGAQIAVSTTGADAGGGLWIVDAASGEAQPAADTDALGAAFNTVYASTPLVTLGPVRWSPDGARVMVWGGSSTTRPPQLWPLLVDLAGSSVSALNLPMLANDTPDKRMLRPIQAAWLPDGAQVMALATGRDRATDETPLDAANPQARMSVYLADASGGDARLFGHLPLMASAGMFPAVWSAQGAVIVNGYALQTGE